MEAVYAQIKDGRVENLAVFSPDVTPNDHFMGYDAHVRIPDGLPVSIGDTYRDGSFYRDGVLVEPIPETA